MSLIISKNADDVGTLVQVSMDIIQRTLFRFYEITELEKRGLTDDEIRSLTTLDDFATMTKTSIAKLKSEFAT